MPRKRIIVDEDYEPTKGDRVCIKTDPNHEGGTVTIVGSEQSEVKWDEGYSAWYPHHYLILKPVRQRKRLLD